MADQSNLVEAVKRGMRAGAKKDPDYRIKYHKELLTGEEAAQRMDDDKEFCNYMLERYIGIAVKFADKEGS